jgi:hypothetical protein
MIFDVQMCKYADVQMRKNSEYLRYNVIQLNQPITALD